MLIGLFVLLVRETKRQEAAFMENVEMELKQVWNKAVVQGVDVKYSIEYSERESNIVHPAAVTITLP